MNSFVIAAVVVTLILLVGVGLAGLMVAFSGQVNRVQTAVSQPKTINPQVSLGHALTLNAAPAEMMAEAEVLAAKRAAQQPRGANMRIGRLGTENLLTARKGVKDDPITAVKIARYHGWEIFKTENPWLQPAAPEPTAVAAAAPAARSADDLVPGKDYPFIEVTDSMSPEEVRKARVANAKAKSAAVKALKDSGETAAPAAAAPTAVAPAAAAPKLDYQEIPITDNMSPEEIRKARIANAKAKSAAAKAAKESGVAVAAAPRPRLRRPLRRPRPPKRKSRPTFPRPIMWKLPTIWTRRPCAKPASPTPKPSRLITKRSKKRALTRRLSNNGRADRYFSPG
jgi:hypothetical protein